MSTYIKGFLIEFVQAWGALFKGLFGWLGDIPKLPKNFGQTSASKENVKKFETVYRFKIFVIIILMSTFTFLYRLPHINVVFAVIMYLVAWYRHYELGSIPKAYQSRRRVSNGWYYQKYLKLRHLIANIRMLLWMSFVNVLLLVVLVSTF